MFPTSRMEADNGFNMGRSAEISRDEVKFYKFIERLRNKFNELFLHLLKTQLVVKGVMSKEEFDDLSHEILFSYNRDNYFSELKETEIMKERLEMMRDVGEFIGQYFSKEYVYKKILRLTDEEADEMKKQIDKEREEEPPEEDEFEIPMSEDDYNDMFKAVVNSSVVDFEDAFNKAISTKVSERLRDAEVATSSSLMQNQTDSEEGEIEDEREDDRSSD